MCLTFYLQRLLIGLYDLIPAVSLGSVFSKGVGEIMSLIYSFYFYSIMINERIRKITLSEYHYLFTYYTII